MRINKFVVPVLAVSVIALAVVIANVTGDWVTSGKQIVDQKVEAGTLTPDDIRGRMTLQEVADAFGLSIEEIIQKAGLPADIDATIPLRDLKAVVEGFEVSQVRDAVGDR
ncbi:MAG: hypothetical protein H0Z38_04390 [Firmicutes bacterium]|nr:hypothetical protein [Bacillota bacterium]